MELAGLRRQRPLRSVKLDGVWEFASAVPFVLLLQTIWRGLSLSKGDSDSGEPMQGMAGRNCYSKTFMDHLIGKKLEAMGS